MKYRSRFRLLIFGSGFLVILFVLPHLLPTIGEWLGPQIVFSISTKEPTIYLTIDDGPSKHTDEILAVLARHRVHATFFIIGDHVTSGKRPGDR